MNQTLMSVITCAALCFSSVCATEAGDRQNLKAPEEALTLSRFTKNGQPHILAVLDDDGETLTGIDLSIALNRFDRFTLDVIQTLKYDEVVAIIRASKDRITVPYEALLPAIEGNKHIAIGINYDEHGEETSVDAPFLFPKIVDTEPAIHHLKYTSGWLLDHEVELGIVFPDAVCSTSNLPNQRIGFLVVNDYSERATLMRELDVKDIKNGKGFPNAKSMKGFLPTGPYIVVPRDWQSFVAELTLNLHVNGVVRQSGSAKDMVWDISKIIEETLASKNRTWPCHNKNVGLLENNCISANSIIITGTPAGVIFKKPTTGFKVKTASKYFLTLRFFSHQLLPYVMQEHLKKQIREDKYLKPGDFVETSISFLGTIKTTIE